MVDVRSMLNAARDPQERCLVALCGMMGLRVEEARTLQAGAVDLDRRLVRVDGKGGRRRLNPLYSGPAQHVVGRVIAVDFDPAVELVGFGDTRARRCLKDVAKKAGITQTFSSHMLRATFASYLQEQTGDTTIVQKWLGHSDISTTMRYVSLPITRLQEAVADWAI